MLGSSGPATFNNKGKSEMDDDCKIKSSIVEVNKSSGMRILSLEIMNQKAIRCFQLDANGKNIEVAGDTSTGKTTAISALWDILSKGKDTLTHGEAKGVVRVAIGDEQATHYIAERTTTPSKSTVTISKMLGAKALPMDIKDFEAMISKLSVNPHKITDMKPAARIKALLAAADCDIDLDALDAQIDEAEQDRLLAGRSAKASKPVEVPDPTEAVSVSGLIAERDIIVEKNQKNTDNLHRLDKIKEEQAEDLADLEKAREQVALIESGIADRKESIDKGNAWAAKTELIPVCDLDEQIANAEETNQLAAVYTQAVKDHENYVLLQSMHKESDDTVKVLREQKKEALNAIQWPLEGLCVEDGTITYHGVLLENLGESEQMLVTAAIALGDIEKHEIKVVRMDGIESMSKVDYEALRDLFNERGVQVLSTRVSRGEVDEGEIVITEGVYEGSDNS